MLRVCVSSPNEDPLDRIIGESAAIRSLRERICAVARCDRPVLVTGPTGSGKELVVRAIHELSPRCAAPFVDLNCCAFPESLIEGELFGHERGAYTGADEARAGYLETTGEGTLFLDEIAEISLGLQAKLLRVLEQRTFRSLGSTREKHFRGRFIAATHADLSELVEASKFREDLFYRLNVVELHVPSIAERTEDVPLLVRCFGERMDPPVRFSQSALDHLRAHRWSGNVRQIRNFVDRVSIDAGDEEIGLEKVKSIFPNGNSVQKLETLATQALSLASGNKLDALKVKVQNTQESAPRIRSSVIGRSPTMAFIT